jgi:hypothetical protein
MTGVCRFNVNRQACLQQSSSLKASQRRCRYGGRHGGRHPARQPLRAGGGMAHRRTAGRGADAGLERPLY